MVQSVSTRVAGVLLTGLGIFLAVQRPAFAKKSLQPISESDLYDGQRLIDVQFEIPDNDWNKLRNQTLDFVTAFSKGSFQSNYSYFFGSMVIDGRKLNGIELRKKGFFGSMDADRPSLKVRIANADQVRLLGGIQRMTLNNNKQDRSTASQFLAYNMFRAAGVPAPRSGFAKVTVNGKLLGVYTFLESIDERFLQRTFHSDTGNLYEGVFPTDFVNDRLARFDVKTNKKGSEKTDLRQIVGLLENPGDDLVSQLDKIFNLDEFITYWALESLIGFWDGYAANQNNYYLYKNPKDGKIHFIPWGADMAFAPSFFPTPGKKSVYAKGLLAYQLNQHEEIRQRYHQALLKLLDSVWNEQQLLAELDRIEILVKDHVHEAQGDISQNSAVTRTFIKNRRQEIMEEIKDGPIHVTTPPGKSFYMREAGEATGSFATQWSPAEEKSPIQSDQATVALKVDGEVVKLGKLMATAGPARFPGFGGPPGPLPPTVVLTGTRESDQKKLTLTLTFPATQFGADQPEAIAVQGMMQEGEGFMFGAGMRSFIGKVKLESAGQNKGDKVVGSLSGKLYEMRGGFGS